MASEEERLGEKRFEELEPHELERIRQMMSELELAAPRRLSGAGAARAAESSSTCAARFATASGPAATR